MQLESLDMAGSLLGEVATAALGSGIIGPLGRMAVVTGAVGIPSATKAWDSSGQPLKTWLSPLIELESFDLKPKPDPITFRAVVEATPTEKPGHREFVPEDPSREAPVRMFAPTWDAVRTTTPVVQSPETSIDTNRPIVWPWYVGVALPSAQRAELPAFSSFEPPLYEESNQAPVAADDIDTTNEDSSVVLDILANDTDADGDTLSISTWDWVTAHGMVNKEPDGKLRYTPDPDYYGPDSFTYTVTDGRESATGTVSIDMYPVNDAPAAFHDAYVGNSSVIPLPPAPPNTAIIRVPVLGNDIDYDGSGLTVGGLAASGQVAISADKLAVEWTVPKDYTGSTEFQYQAKDADGALSDWATVKVWSYPLNATPDPLPPTIAANPDYFAAGDDPVFANVRWNDTGGTYAVLASHPASGRLVSFGNTADPFSGSFEFKPTIPRPDVEFKYLLINANGKESSYAVAKLPAVQMDVYHGQNGGKVPEKLKELPAGKPSGAFTVSNNNNSDGDTNLDGTPKIDSADNEVAADPDLVKVTIYRPGDNWQIANSMNFRASIFSTQPPNLRFYHDADKRRLWSDTPGQGITLVPADFQIIGEGPIAAVDVWVEVDGPSLSIGDITLITEYGQAQDRCKLTSIWVTKTKFNNTDGATALSADFNEKASKDYFGEWNGILGAKGDWRALNLPTAPGLIGLTNGVEIEFTVAPAGLDAVPIVKIDSTRQRESKVWQVAPNGAKYVEPAPSTVSFPTNKELPNDDSITKDEDNVPDKGNHIYAWDLMGFYGTPGTVDSALRTEWPNPPFPGAAVRISNHLFRTNYTEFVRVRLDGVDFPVPQNKVLGSRASDFVPWHSFVSLKNSDPEGTDKLVRDPDGANEIKEGHGSW